jgi:hypothetical protein
MKNTNLINTNLQPNLDTTSPRRPDAQPRRILARAPKCSALPARGTVQPPWERIMLIHQAVEARCYPNANTLAADLGISTKTANRDIDYMRQRLHLPLKYDSARFGYYYAHPLPSGAVHAVSEVDLFGLLVVSKVMSQYRGTPLEPTLQSAFQKALLSLDPLEFHLLPDLRVPMSVPAPGVDPEILQNFATPGFSA